MFTFSVSLHFLECLFLNFLFIFANNILNYDKEKFPRYKVR